MGKKKKIRKRKTFKVFSYRGFKLEDLVKMDNEQFFKMSNCRSKRRLKNGMRYPNKFYKKIRKAKKNVQYGEKPACVKTHRRNLMISPEMIGSVVAVHNGQDFIKIECHTDMLGHKLGEFAMTKKPIKHGKAGIGATKSSKFVPLK